MMESVRSKNGVPIRLTEERWIHIVENHDDLAGYYDEVLMCIEDPDFVIKGYRNALIALRKKDEKKFLAVVYKKLSGSDGFIITAFFAFFTSKIKLEKEEIIWQRQ